MHILSAINATSIFSILRFSSMMAVTLSKNSWSSLFKFFRSFSMFFCSLSVSGMEVITPAVLRLFSRMLLMRLFSKRALNGLVINESAPAA